jgi:hypothetical protein
MSLHIRGRVSLAISGVLASAALLAASPDNPTRVTIRGRADGVIVEGRPARALKRAGDAGREILTHAAKLRESSADDGVALAYLRAHASELPPVVEAADAARLRRAGAGRAVFEYLAWVSAVDIGPTGEGHRSAIVVAPPPEREEPAYGYGYPVYGGYGVPHVRHVRPFVMHPHPLSIKLPTRRPVE